MKTIKADWIAADWGTTHMRAWAMSSSGDILASGRSDKGMNQLSSNDFEPALLGLISDWLDTHQKTTVVACGMVGAKQGWVEAHYQQVPCLPLEMMSLAKAQSFDERIDVFVLPGLMQQHPTDIMRGEECQIAGLLSGRSDFTGSLCLPGTHSKWAEIVEGKVLSFKTCMTGELFALLSQQSILRHSINGDMSSWNISTLIDAALSVLNAPENLTAQLFAIRSESIVNDLHSATAKSELSGLLIGAELAATRQYWEFCSEMILIGSQSLVDIYHEVLSAAGINVNQKDATDMTLSGLYLAYQFLHKDLPS